MNRSVYSFLHFPASDMTTGGYIVTDGQHQYGGYASTKCRGRLQYPSTCNAEGAEEPSPQQKKTGGFMAVPAWKEAPEQLFCYTCTTSVAVFAFWISFTSVPAFSERFSGRKFHHTEIFCRKPKGKRADPQERANFDEEGGNFSRSDGIIDFLLHLFRPTGQDFHAIVPMGIIAIPSWSEIFLLYWCFSN